jgi:hypothetical protein
MEVIGQLQATTALLPFMGPYPLDTSLGGLHSLYGKCGKENLTTAGVGTPIPPVIEPVA